MSALGPDARALLALGVLAALPGIAVVRSPWRAMPLLSLSFWALSWTWLGDASRTRWLHGTLALFAALALLRLARPGPLSRPRGPQLLVAALGAALLLPFAVWPVAPGTRMPLESAATLILSWRESWPPSFEPLWPIPFHASGVATLAADVTLLSGAPAHRAALLVALAGGSALVLGLWSLSATVLPAGAAAALAAAAALLSAAPPGTGPGALAAALAAQAAALWRGHGGKPSAFAVGACAAAAIAVHPTTGAAALALAFIGTSLLPPSRRAVPRRGRVAVATGLVLVAPVLLRAGVDAPQLGPLLSLGLTACVLCAARRAALARPARGHPRAAPLFAAAVIAAAAARAAAVTRSTGRALPSPDALAAMEWIRDHARPLDVVCAAAGRVSEWVPAVSGRRTIVSATPAGPRQAACAFGISVDGEAGGGAAMGAPAFRTRSSEVWTSHGSR